MTRFHLRTVATKTFVCAGCLFSLAAAQHSGTIQASTFTNQAQAAAKAPRPAQSRTQKLANPLNDLLDEAQQHINKNEFEAAIEPLQKVIAEEPEFAYAHFQLAYVYTALKKPKEAQAEYVRTIALDPKMSEAYVNLGTLLLDADPAAARGPLSKAVELLPAQSRPRFLLGVAEERAGNLAKAADSFEGAARLDPTDAEILGHLAGLYLQLKRPADAEAKFRRVLEIQPNESHALLGLAHSLDAQQKAEAIAAYRNYLVVQPSDGAARSRLVRLLLDAQQGDAALAELDRANAGKPTVESLKLRADIQIGQKKWNDAVATLVQAVALAPNDAQLHGGLGRTYLQVRDFANAEKELKMALQLDAKNIDYWRDLSSTYYLSKNYASTLAVLDRIDQFETPGAGSWFIRALCYDNLRQPKPALEAYQKFLELDQNKNPDQVWQAQERSKVLRRMLEGKK
ncbi:MAG TPA: tetratricopeptide repeat protein [Candidatus Angelobacter sp.]|nr:tetratricopeptide repeat protein [Candidatus Angelobacter sp.]